VQYECSSERECNRVGMIHEEKEEKGMRKRRHRLSRRKCGPPIHAIE